MKTAKVLFRVALLDHNALAMRREMPNPSMFFLFAFLCLPLVLHVGSNAQPGKKSPGRMGMMQCPSQPDAIRVIGQTARGKYRQAKIAAKWWRLLLEGREGR